MRLSQFIIVSLATVTPLREARVTTPAGQLGTRCLPTTGGDFAHRSYPVPLSVVNAESILICTTQFEFGLMPPKRQGQAFNMLFEQPDALARFRSVASVAGPAGKLYAFIGLRLLASPDADRLAEALARDQHRVLAKDSDVNLGSRPASELVALAIKRQIGEEFRKHRDAITAYFNKAVAGLSKPSS